MKKEKNLIAEYTTEYQGQTVKIKKFKTKNKKSRQNVRRNVFNCPNCLSSVKIDELGIWECTGDKLKIWEEEFNKFYHLPKDKKDKYIKTIISDSRFLDLYDKWVYSYENNKSEEFTCGYTNKIFLPIVTVKCVIPDPIYTKFIESRINRKLTLEEISGEDELWIYKGSVYKKYRKGANKIRIPFIRFPEDIL
jgi:ribosomal protein L37AE/L43A